MVVRRKKRTSRRRKTINIPLVSTASGLAIFTALNGQGAINAALKGQIGPAIQTVASAMGNPANKAALSAAVGGAVVAKMLLKNMPRNVGKLGPVVFTTG